MTETMHEQAAEILRRNDADGWTMAAPTLYPHQWSWDSAIIAVGWAHLDPERAMRELEHLYAAQWDNGKLPHIVFNPDADDPAEFPEAHWWDCSVASGAPPPPIRTSGLCQPPVHASAVLRICRLAERRDGRLSETMRRSLSGAYPRLLAWHRYLASERDPEGSGLVTIYHPWEGLDNSPRWDAALDRLTVGTVPAYRRRDLQAVDDPAERPSEQEYRRYLWLVELLKRARYDDGEIQRSHPFLIKDVFFSAIFVAANEALLELSRHVEAPEDDRREITRWIERGRRALADRWDPELQLCLDYDLRVDRPIRVRTVAGFAPLVAGTDPVHRRALLEQLDSRFFTGHPDLRWPLPPSTSPEDPAFDPRNYWRGPTWPVVNWFIWEALQPAGEHERAARPRDAALEQIQAVGFSEYFEPFTGEPPGAASQSWTAAVALEWLAEGPALSLK